MQLIGFLAFAVYGIAQIVAGYQGIAEGIGPWWAAGALVLAFLFRFTLPITIGSFFGAINVWGWHWFFAFLFAAPGLALMIPSLALSVAGSVGDIFRRKEAGQVQEETKKPKSYAWVGFLVAAVIIYALINARGGSGNSTSVPTYQAPAPIAYVPQSNLSQQFEQLAPPVQKTPEEMVAERYPDWKATIATKEFRDWYAAMPVGVQDLGRSNEAKDLVSLLDLYTDTVRQKLAAQETERIEVAKLDGLEPEWRSIVASPAFRSWMQSKSVEERQKFADTRNAEYVAGVISRFRTMSAALKNYEAQASAPAEAISKETPTQTLTEAKKD